MANDNFALGIGVVAGLGYLFTRMKDDKEEFREEEWYPRFYRERMALKKTRKQTKDAEMVYRKYKGRKGPALSATSVKRVQSVRAVLHNEGNWDRAGFEPFATARSGESRGNLSDQQGGRGNDVYLGFSHRK